MLWSAIVIPNASKPKLNKKITNKNKRKSGKDTNYQVIINFKKIYPAAVVRTIDPITN